MTPARSLAASVAALSFAGALTAPQPAFAAPAPCERAENYAAQSGAELLRINKLEVRASAPERPRIKRAPEKTGVAADATDRVLGTDVDPIPDPEDSDTLSEGIGILGDAVVGGLLEGSRRAAPTGGEGGAGAVPSAASTLTERGSTLTGGGGGGADGGDGSADGFDGVGGGSGGQGGGSGFDGTRGDSADGFDGATGSNSSGGDADGVNSGGVSGRSSGGQGGGARTGATGDEDGTATDEGSADDGDDQGDSATGGSQDSAGTGDDATDDGGADDGGADDGGAAAEGEASGRDEAGRTAQLRDVTVGEARTAMIGNARVASAAYARVINARSDGRSSVGEPLLQQAPPTNAEAARRGTAAGRVGPVRLGKGSIGTHARWEAGMACGRTVGETGRADASLAGVSLLGTLVRAPQKLTSSGTTALERRGDEARTVAAATIGAGRIELADGRIRVRVLRAPTLTAGMSTTAGGEVRYRPAVVEVSGEGVATKRLDTAGEHVDIALRADRRGTESAALRRLTDLGGIRKGDASPLPAVPGLPPVAGAPQTESAPAAGLGTSVRISLGDVRHASKGHAIAAKATAVKVSLRQTAATDGRIKPGYAGQPRPGVAVDLGFGLLEAAAVAPEKAIAASTAGVGGGLPITGPRLDRIAMAGGALILAGIVAVVATRRRRHTQ